MYCIKCGREMEEIWTECPSCHEHVLTKKTVINKGSKWWGVFAYFFPFWGVVLFFNWVTIKPTAAKSIAVGLILHLLMRSAGLL